jgi:hypothetical protein
VGVVPAVDEVVPGEDRVDVVEDVTPVPPARPTAQPAGEDDVEVVDEQVEDTDDVEVVDAGSPPAATLDADALFARAEVPEEMRQEIRRELSKNETAVWVGRPCMELVIHSANVARMLGIVFLLVSCGLFVGIAFAPAGATVGLAAVGAMTLLFGVVLTFGRAWALKQAGSRAVYLLTNRRALIYQHRGLPVKSYNIAQLKNMQRKDSTRLDGAGDLIFETEVLRGLNAGSHRPDVDAVGAKSPVHHHGFLQLRDVRAVEKLVRETLLDRVYDKVLKPGQ